MEGARSILFVCRANLCRSPSAEAILRTMLNERGVGARFEIDSAGTHDFRSNAPPHVSSVDAAHRRGYDLSGCRSRRITPGDFERFDMILAMDKGVLSDLHRVAPTRCKRKIELLLNYGERYQGEEVPDPIGGDARRFDTALDRIEDGCRGLVQLLLRAA
jgi:protein-tyrosine phosphatase